MSFDWVADRVSSTHKNKVSGADNGGWGPNSQFRYPGKGGIGAIFRRMSHSIDNHILLQHKVTGIDLEKKNVTTANSEVFSYKALLNTAPLDQLVNTILQPAPDVMLDAASQLVHNSVTVVGIGVDASGDRNTSWMYFPESHIPFYRLTHLHNYAPDITPEHGQSALMVEVATVAGQRPESEDLVAQVISSLIATGQLKAENQKDIISTWTYFAPYGYPIPTLARDKALTVIHSYLENYSVYSRGRFGGWRYEVGNMDHSVMQGIEWADRMVRGTEEKVYLRTIP
jgi:protoporphyrinogen oxidase